MTAARLVLVRHGESTWNAHGRLQGQADPPLSPRGRSDAEALRPWLARWPVDRAVCSDLRRAHETAALLGRPDAHADPRWREIDVGEWTGAETALVAVEEQDAYQAWRDGRRPPPGGEPVTEFAARVQDAAHELLAAGGTTLVVAHGGPIRVVCAGLVGIDLHRLARVDNLTATVVEGFVDGAARLVAYNAAP